MNMPDKVHIGRQPSYAGEVGRLFVAGGASPYATEYRRVIRSKTTSTGSAETKCNYCNGEWPRYFRCDFCPYCGAILEGES